MKADSEPSKTATQLIADGMNKIAQAISRARLPIWTIAGVYALAIFVGVLMVHGGNSLALDFRDKLVGQAAKRDPAPWKTIVATISARHWRILPAI